MTRTLAFIGVPSSAGAHFPGQEKTPAALRSAGFRMESMHDYGDLPCEQFQPDRTSRCARNADAVIRVAKATRDRTRRAVDAGHVPFVIGGDCSITTGVVAALVERHPDLGLVYFDAHADLNTPLRGSGIFDSMGLAHMLDEPGVVRELAHIGRRPLLSRRDVVIYGANLKEMNAQEIEALERLRIATSPADRDNAKAIEHWFESEGRPFLVHFDVDVVDFADLPLANIPQFSPGVPWLDALHSLEVFAVSPRFAGLVVTEANPDHDPDGSAIRVLASALSRIARLAAGNMEN